MFDRRRPGPSWPGGWGGGKRKGKRQQWGEGRHGAGMQPPGSWAPRHGFLMSSLGPSLFWLSLIRISSASTLPLSSPLLRISGQASRSFSKVLCVPFHSAIATARSIVFIYLFLFIIFFPCRFGGLSPRKPWSCSAPATPCTITPTPQPAYCIPLRQLSLSPSSSPAKVPPCLFPKGPGKGLESPEKFPL